MYFPSIPSVNRVMDTLHTVTASCKEASCKLQVSATKYKDNLLNSIPVEHRKNIPLRAAIATAVALPMFYLYSLTDKSPAATNGLVRMGIPMIIGIDYLVRSRFANNRSKEIKQTIEETRSEAKEGVALILTAPKTADHNFAFAEGEGALNDIKILAKRFLIESKTIATPQQAVEAIEEVCKVSSLPVKVVYFQGHGILQAVHLGHGQELRADSPGLIEALKKTDESAHIIFKSCSTGKLRSAQGVSLADQLSLKLLGRTVTANSMDAGAGLREDKRFPQGITLYNAVSAGWDSAEIIPSHSFCVKENERLVRILTPFHISGGSTDFKEKLNLFMKKYELHTGEDNKHKNNELTNKYRYFPILC